MDSIKTSYMYVWVLIKIFLNLYSLSKFLELDRFRIKYMALSLITLEWLLQNYFLAFYFFTCKKQLQIFKNKMNIKHILLLQMGKCPDELDISYFLGPFKSWDYTQLWVSARITQLQGFRETEASCPRKGLVSALVWALAVMVMEVCFWVILSYDLHGWFKENGLGDQPVSLLHLAPH